MKTFWNMSWNQRIVAKFLNLLEKMHCRKAITAKTPAQRLKDMLNDD